MLSERDLAEGNRSEVYRVFDALAARGRRLRLAGFFEAEKRQPAPVCPTCGAELTSGICPECDGQAVPAGAGDAG